MLSKLAVITIAITGPLSLSVHKATSRETWLCGRRHVICTEPLRPLCWTPLGWTGTWTCAPRPYCPTALLDLTSALAERTQIPAAVLHNSMESRPKKIKSFTVAKKKVDVQQAYTMYVQVSIYFWTYCVSLYTTRSRLVMLKMIKGKKEEKENQHEAICRTYIYSTPNRL